MFKKLFGLELETVTSKTCAVIVCIFTMLFLLGGTAGFFLGSFYVNEKKSMANELPHKPQVALNSSSFIDNLKKNIPNLKSVSISDSGIAGIREVIMEETGEVFYADSDGKNIFIGAWVDENGINLTKVKMDELAKIKFTENMQSIDKSKAIKIGNGKNEVIEFTDVDCPFCLRAEGFFDAPDSDAVRYIFLTPIDSLHPEAAKKSIHILCSADRATEYKRVLLGEVMNFTTCSEGEELLKIHRAAGEKVGVQGTPQFYVNGVHFSGANPLIYEEIKRK